jgi:hypothetical protein
LSEVSDRPTTGDARCQSVRIDASDVLSVAFRRFRSAIPVRDISRGGFSIETSRQFTVGSLHRVRFTARRGPRVELIARTVHTGAPAFPGSRKSITGFAFMLVQLPETVHQIDQLIAAVAAQERRHATRRSATYDRPNEIVARVISGCVGVARSFLNTK